MVVLGHRVLPLLKRTWAEILDDNVLGLAAQTAYYFFFSLFPLLLFAAPLLGLIGGRELILGRVMASAAQALPPAAFDLLDQVVSDVVLSDNAPGLISMGAVLALWAGSNIFSALIDALNRAYDVTETRPWTRRKLLSLAAVIVAGGALVAATLTMLAGEDLVRWFAGQLGLGAQERLAWTVLQYVLAFALLVGSAWMLFYFLPNVKQDPRRVLVGAVVTTLLWIVVTFVFRAYVQNFGSYNATYGTIGGVIVLLLWMYLSMLVLLSGGELNSELHRGTGAIHPRTGLTIGGRIVTSEPTSSTARIDRVAAGKK